MVNYTIKAGDSYNLKFNPVSGGQCVNTDMFSKIELNFNGENYYYPDDIQIKNGKLIFPMTQEMTFDLENKTKEMQFRFKTKGGDVMHNIEPITFTFTEATSEEEL